MFKKFVASTAIALTFGLGAAQAQEVNFGIISTESSQSLRQSWQPLLDDMGRKTGLKINAFFASDYAGVIEAMRFNKVQLAWFGNKSAMEAVDRANGEIFAKIVNADGTEGYYSHLIVHKDSPIKSVDDMLKNAKSLAFGNGDPNSTSGYLVPSYYVFAKHNVDAKTAFRVSRSGNHEANALAVANKQVDVATNNSENMEKLHSGFPEKFNELRIIWTSPLIPSDPIVMRKDLPEPVKAKLKTFFLGYAKTDAHEKEVMMNLYKWGGFRESSDAQLIPIRQLDLFSKRVKIESDANLSDADKKTRLAEVDAKLAALK